MSSRNEPRSLFSKIWGKIVAAEEEAATSSYLSFSLFLRETVSVGPTNCLRVCQINTDQTTFTSRPKTRVYVIGFKNCEVILLSKKTTGADLYFSQNMRCKIAPFPFFFFSVL